MICVFSDFFFNDGMVTQRLYRVSNRTHVDCFSTDKKNDVRLFLNMFSDFNLEIDGVK